MVTYELAKLFNGVSPAVFLWSDDIIKRSRDGCGCLLVSNTSKFEFFGITTVIVSAFFS